MKSVSHVEKLLQSIEYTRIIKQFVILILSYFDLNSCLFLKNPLTVYTSDSYNAGTVG